MLNYAEDEHGTIYDLEMQNQNHHDIEKRMAIYQGKKEQIIDFLVQNLNLDQQEANQAYNQAMATA